MHAGQPNQVQNIGIATFQNSSNSSMVTLQWDAPVGSAVDNYSIAISPNPLSGALLSTTATQTTITLQYNVNYTLQITAVNCIGDGTLTVYMLMLGKVHNTSHCCDVMSFMFTLIDGSVHDSGQVPIWV